MAGRALDMFVSQSNAALDVSENRFQTLVDSIEDYAIYMLDPFGHVVTWNLGAKTCKGYTSSEVLGRHFRMFFVAEDIEAKIPEIELADACRLGRCAGEGWRLRKNGERFWASFVITPIRNEAGMLSGFAKITRDLTEVKRAQDASRAMKLALAEERDCLYNAAECTLDALFICEAIRGDHGEIEDFVFSYLNTNVEKMTSLPRSAILGGRMCDLFPSHLANGLFANYKRVVETGEPLILELQSEQDCIKAPWRRIQALKHHDGVAISISDITDRKLNELRTLHMANHDPLTGLPNRSLLHDRIGQSIERTRRFGGRVAVFMVDLDSFKHINDSLGHAAGDAVLITAGVRLRAALRATDSVIRIGGDEFVVVMSDISDPHDIQNCANKVLDSLQSSIEIDGHSIRITCSLGVAVYPDSARTVAELLGAADAAMYAAKRAGKNQIAVSAASGFPSGLPVGQQP